MGCILLVAPGSVSVAKPRPKCFGLVATIVGDKGDNLLKGTARDDIINAKGGDDQILASGGDDVICGGKGEDVIDGGDGDDIIFGGGADDSIQAGPGNDIMLGQGGNDTMDGREGDLDQIDYSLSATPVQADLGTPHLVTGEGSDSVFAVEVVVGSEFADTLTSGVAGAALLGLGGNDHLNGAGADDTLDGGAGDDTISGAGGTDALAFLDAPTGVSVDLAAGTAIGDGSDTVATTELVFGSEHNDTLRGNDSPNLFAGMGGNDVIDGRGDLDVIAFPLTTAGVTVDMALGTTSGDGTDTFSAVEGVYGSPFDDSLTGDAQANTLYGGGGNDTLKGLAGNDYFLPDLGNDTVDGGDGDYDIVDFAFASTGVDASLTTGSASGDGQDSISGVESFSGSGFDDVLEGSAADDVLFGAIGDDLLKGAGGDDALDGGPNEDFADGGPGFDTCSGNEGGTSCEGAASPPSQPIAGKGRSLGGAQRRARLAHRLAH
jgi:Ca2+-binding RTX toxin-like protein